MVLLFLNQASCQTDRITPEHQSIKVYRKVENQGFHRFLTTEVLMLNFKNTKSIHHFDNEYQLLLVDHFDADVYVDSNELRYMNYEEKFRFIFSNTVSIEQAKYQARQFNLFLLINPSAIKCYFNSERERDMFNFFNSLKTHGQIFNLSDQISPHELTSFCITSIRLPIHVRYHEPAFGDYVNFTLRRPSLFYLTDKHNPQNTNMYKRANFNLAMLINSTTFSAVEQMVFPCEKGKHEKYTDKLILQRTYDYLTRTYLKANDQEIDEDFIHANLDGLCVWSKLDYEILNSEENVRIFIPVANKSQELVVLITTIIVVTFLLYKVVRCILSHVERSERQSTKNQRFGDSN